MGEVEEDASVIISSSNREKVIGVLIEGPTTPSRIREETGQEYSRISEALGSLKEKGLVELLVDEDTHSGRIYETTERGEAAWEYVTEHNLTTEH